MKFNGQDINSLAQLCRLVEGCEEPYIRFDLIDHKALVLDTKAAREAEAEVLQQHNIPFSKSEELR